MQDELYDSPVADQAAKNHAQYIEERKGLIDAARESSRTFDQAVLAFGSAIFGASIAFLKDVAPKPQHYTLKWLGLSWCFFIVGLLGVMLSFLFSHRACMFEIEVGAKERQSLCYKRPNNHWSSLTTWCNYLCVGFLFFGLMAWSVFAFENLSAGEIMLSNQRNPQSDKAEKGYVPPPPAPRTPPPTTIPANSPPTTPSKK